MSSMIEFDKRVNRIMSKAKALLKDRYQTKVYGVERDLFIASSDGAMLVHYQLPADERPFPTQFRFNVKDYDGKLLKEQDDGSLYFESKKSGFTQRKYVKPTGHTPAQVRSVFNSYKLDNAHVIYLPDMRELVRRDLFFVELSVVDGVFRITQKESSGAVASELLKDNTSEGILDALPLEDFGPVGVGAGEFLFPFSLTDKVTINIPKSRKFPEYVWMESLDHRIPFISLIASKVEIVKDSETQRKGKRK